MAGLSIEIQDIKEVSYKNSLPNVSDLNLEEGAYKLAFHLEVEADIEKKELSFILSFSVVSEIETLIELVTLTKFKYSGDEESINEKMTFKDGLISFDDDLMALFIRTATGATRGMFAYKMASLPININIPLFDELAIAKKFATKIVD